MLSFYASAAGRVFLRRQATILAVLAMAMLALFELTDVDRAISWQFFDTQRDLFPLKSNEFIERIFHRGARALSVLCALLVVIATLLAWFAPRRFPQLAVLRAELTYLSVALVDAPLLVGVLKEISNRACPWDIVGFGGEQPYLRLLDSAPTGERVGACFPGAHAVSGLTWMALAVVLYPRHRIRAVAIGWAALIVGQFLGFLQLMRGAHFLSHNLWAAWLVWALDIVLIWVASRWGARASP